MAEGRAGTPLPVRHSAYVEPPHRGPILRAGRGCEVSDMTWQLSGEYLQNCNCEVLCPCITSSLQGPADNARCVLPFAMHIAEGEADGVRLDDLGVVLVVDAP